MKRRTLPALLLLFLPTPGAPESAPAPEHENYCHDPEAWARIDALHRQHPQDQALTRAYVLRAGICRLVDEGKLSLEEGIGLFELEKRRAVMERAADEAARRRPRPLMAEDVEPQG